MKYEEKVLLKTWWKDECNRLLDGPCVTDTKRDAVLQKFSIPFGNGYEADIKVCNGGSGPWIDAVLFDGRGCEVAVTEPGGGPIEGEYVWQVGDTYTLILV